MCIKFFKTVIWTRFLQCSSQLVFVFTFFLLILSLYFNIFHVVEEHEHLNPDDVRQEAVVVGRLAKSSRDGIFSGLGQVGFYAITDNKVPPFEIDINLQKKILFKEIVDVSNYQFITYKSSVSLHGIVWSIVNKALPFGGESNLKIIEFLNILFTAIILSLILFYIFSKFGTYSYLGACLAILGSRWLNLLANNLAWPMGAFFLPIWLSLNYNELNKKLIYPFMFFSKQVGQQKRLYGLMFFSYFLVSLCNYSKSPVALTSMAVPFALTFFGENKVDIKKMLQAYVKIFLKGCIFVLITIFILFLELSSYTESFSKGAMALAYIFTKRSYGSTGTFVKLYSMASGEKINLDIYANTSLKEGFGYTGTNISLMEFINRVFWERSEVFLKFSFVSMLVFFLFTYSIGFLYRSKFSAKTRFQVQYLGFASFLFLAGALSWYVVSKQLCFTHPRMTSVVFTFAFTPFAFSYFGKVLEGVCLHLKDVLLKNKKKLP